MKYTSAIIALSAVLALAQAAGVLSNVPGAESIAGPVAQVKKLTGSLPVVAGVADAVAKRQVPGLGDILKKIPVVGSVPVSTEGLNLPEVATAKRSTLERRGHKSHRTTAFVNARVHLKASLRLLEKLVTDVVANVHANVRADLIAKVAAKIRADTRLRVKAHVDIEAQVKIAVAKLLDLHLHTEALLNADVHVWIAGILHDLIKIDANVNIGVLIDHVTLALDAKIKNLALNLDLGLYVKAVAHIKALGLLDVDVDLKDGVKLGLDVDGLVKGVHVDVGIKADVCVDGLVHLGV